MDMASVHKYPIKMITDNGTFKKLSLEWNFWKCCFHVYVKLSVQIQSMQIIVNTYVSSMESWVIVLKVIIFKSIPCVYVDGENNAFDMNLDLFQHNSHVDDLFTDLSDGRLLISLLEIISGEKLGKIGKTANF